MGAPFASLAMRAVAEFQVLLGALHHDRRALLELGHRVLGGGDHRAAGHVGDAARRGAPVIGRAVGIRRGHAHLVDFEAERGGADLTSTVSEPWPLSTAPVFSTAVPSSRMRTIAPEVSTPEICGMQASPIPRLRPDPFDTALRFASQPQAARTRSRHSTARPC